MNLPGSEPAFRTLADCAPGTRVELIWDATVEEVLEFARLSGDHSPIHVSHEAAVTRGFPGIVAHGALLTAKFSSLLGMQLPGADGVLQSVELQFRSPVCPPCQIYFALEVERVSAAAGQIKLAATAKNSAGVVCASGTFRSLLRPPPVMSKPVFNQLLSILESKYPNYARVWKEADATQDAAWHEDVSNHISKVFGAEPNERWHEAVDGYAEFCTEALRAQVFFEKHGHYKASNYEEVVAACYHDADYMCLRYLPGQYLSHFIWPHHGRMLQHFVNDLLPRIAPDVKLFYEIGVGCGMYSLRTLLALPECRGIGHDISTYATDFTYRVVEAHGQASRYSVSNDDIVSTEPAQKADFVINQEVLEHLERPDLFVQGLLRTVRPGGWGYITAAINAAHTDHIYLYRSPEEVAAHLTAAGWEIVDVQIERNYPEKPLHLQPTVAGFLVRRPQD